jgi:hypothetical protein
MSGLSRDENVFERCVLDLGLDDLDVSEDDRKNERVGLAEYQYTVSSVVA